MTNNLETVRPLFSLNLLRKAIIYLIDIIMKYLNIKITLEIGLYE